jgi:large subunit ribosomal protein L25
MSKQQLILNVTSRPQTGRSASRRVRKANQIPAIVYGKHSKPEALAVDAPEFIRLLKTISGRALLIELNRKDSSAKALTFLQEVQRDPITDKYLHLDLQEVKANEKLEIRVPVLITGESFGVSKQNGVLEIGAHALRVRCFPKDLPPVIEVDVTELKVGETLKVGTLKPIAGVEFLDVKGQPVVSCVEPVGEIASAAPAAGAAAAGAKPAAGAAAAAPAAAAGAKPAAGAAAAPAAAGAKPAAAPAKK